MVAAAGEKASPENIINKLENKLQGAEEESETQSGARVDNLEKMVKQLSASLEVTNQTALGADMHKHTKDFLKTEIDAQMAKATGRITETKQGMENNKQQIENIAQELTAKTSNFVTNQRVTKLETEINDNLVKKISNLEKEIAKKINTVTKEEMENKFAGIAKEVDRVPTLEKSVSKLEEEVANDTKSIIKKITKIEETLQGMDKLGKQLLGIDTRLTTIENHNKCKNCKSNPCLHGKPITSKNFVHKAYCKGSAGTKGNSIHGHIYIGGFGKYQGEKYTGKWLCYSYPQNKGEEFTQAFTENVKSLKFSCHI